MPVDDRSNIELDRLYCCYDLLELGQPVARGFYRCSEKVPLFWMRAIELCPRCKVLASCSIQPCSGCPLINGQSVVVLGVNVNNIVEIGNSVSENVCNGLCSKSASSIGFIFGEELKVCKQRNDLIRAYC